MGAHALGAFIVPEDPKSTRQVSNSKHDVRPVEASPNDVELDSMPVGINCRYTGPQKPPPAAKSSRREPDEILPVVEPDGLQTPPSPIETLWRTPNELEMSGPPTPNVEDAATIVESWNNPPITKWRVLTTCLVYFCNGCNDSAPGALIPYVEKYYNIDYAPTAIIFLTNAIGFIIAAFFVHAIDTRLGRAKTLMLCEAIISIGLAIMIIPPPYPLFTIGYFITGFGQSVGLALNNVYCSNLASATVILGISHGAYGIGGTIAPILATTLATRGVLFSRFYAILLGFRAINVVATYFAFRHYTGHILSSQQRLNQTKSDNVDDAQHSRSSNIKSRAACLRPLLSALGDRITLTGALFIFAYQGAEVAISGWIISFLIGFRGGDPSKVGYVTAGFWAGITVGRFTLVHFTHLIGEKTFTTLLTIGSFALEIAVWRWPSIIGDSVFIALIGLLLGPICPFAASVFTRLLPSGRQQSTAMAFIWGAGSSGGAAAPFVTGLLAQVVRDGGKTGGGTWILHPVALVLYAVMMVCWLSLPRKRKEQERRE